jgi:hypothetical protein
MFGFLTEWDELCEPAGISGPQYRHKLLMAVGPEVQERLQGQRIVETDEEFREQVLTTGRHLKRWKQELGLRTLNRTRPDCERPRDHDRPRLSERPRERDHDQAPRPWSDPTRPVNLSAKTSTGSQAPTSFRRQYELRFSSVKEAIRGIPEDVLEGCRKAGDCLRCGWKKDAPGAHQSINCIRPADKGTEAPSGSRPQHRVAAVRRSAEPDFDDDELDDEREAKRSRVGIAALDAEETPLYAGYGSEDNFSD